MTNDKRLKNDLALIEKGALELIGKDDLKEKLNRYYDGARPLVIKLGLDPSAPDIHLGHTVVLRKIRQFQDMGHKAMLIIGDFTGRIGDPTGKSKTRRQLTEREVLQNADTYRKQLLKVLDPDKTIICFNSEWLDAITLKDMMEFMSKQSLFRMLERDGFKKRMNAGEAIFYMNCCTRCCRVLIPLKSKRIWRSAAWTRSSTSSWGETCRGGKARKSKRPSSCHLLKEPTAKKR